MRRYISVFEMIVRSSVYKVIGILAALVLVEVGTFYICLQQPLAQIQPNLEEVVDQSHFSIIALIAYMLLSVILVRPGMNVGSMQSYTLKRLRIQEKYIFVLQTIYNVLCYVLLWGTQVGILLVVSQFYMQYQISAIRTNQTIFLAFHRNEFMHAILPLQDSFKWFLLMGSILVSGVIMAAITWQQRNGGRKNEA